MSARVALLGSGAFAIPSFSALIAASGIKVPVVVTQPDRPAGRGRVLEPTPVGAWAAGEGLRVIKPEDINAPEWLDLLKLERIDALAVIAFGQKLSPSVLEGRVACNLHGSLLPRWRGAAPIQRSVMAGDDEVGVTVISIAPRMDAGLVYARVTTTIGASETSGDLHDRLAQLGVSSMVGVVQGLIAGTAQGSTQDESLATRARRLSRADAWVDLGGSARAVCARINGLSPWPGTDCTITGEGTGPMPIKVLRCRTVDAELPMGTVATHGVVGCGEGAIEVLEAQLPGGKPMPLADLMRGRRWSRAILTSEPHAPTAH
ncbi:MAG: methionyl-tRNA formyltransferase [Phycisphaerae bacterium]|nr:methionyl-tRNA formyltransferase [Phycisphaerae bacterium]